MRITVEKSYREIDALIAEHLLGWVKEEKLGMKYLYPHPNFSLGACSYWEPILWNRLAVADFLPHFSTQIQGAWQIVEVFEKTCRFHLSGFCGGTYRATFGEATSEAGSIQLAICLAALKSKELSLLFLEGVAPENPLKEE